MILDKLDIQRTTEKRISDQICKISFQNYELETVLSICFIEINDTERMPLYASVYVIFLQHFVLQTYSFLNLILYV